MEDPQPPASRQSLPITLTRRETLKSAEGSEYPLQTPRRPPPPQPVPGGASTSAPTWDVPGLPVLATAPIAKQGLLPNLVASEKGGPTKTELEEGSTSPHPICNGQGFPAS